MDGGLRGDNAGGTTEFDTTMSSRPARVEVPCTILVRAHELNDGFTGCMIDVIERINKSAKRPISCQGLGRIGVHDVALAKSLDVILSGRRRTTCGSGLPESDCFGHGSELDIRVRFG